MTKKIVKIIAIVCASILFCAVVTGVIIVAKWKKSAEYVNFDKRRLNEVYTSLTILDNNGQTLNEPLYLYDYKQVPLDALPDYAYMAFVAVEDKRFFNHNGIDYKRVAGAMLHNLKSGGYKEGASTISQQLIKNTHLNNNKTLKRKLNEMLLARELEKNYNKRDILEMYLNTIYFGRNAYGIESAANVYFNKSAQDLSVSESAILAGMIKAPNTYAPDKNADKCRTRRNNVLKVMLEQEIIDENQYDEAVASEITYRPQTVNADKSYGYQVMLEACRLLNMTPMQLAQSNFVIETYCEPNVQAAVQQLVKSNEVTDKSGKLLDISCVVTNNDGGVEACYFRGESCGTARQVGSALKPIAVYAPALNERIITQASPVLDEETDFNGYKPSNAGGYNGWTTIKTSVAKSLNVPAVKTLNALGLSTAEQYLSKMGITGEQNLSLALGNTANGVNIFTLAKCYETLANNGICDGLRFIKNIYNENGLVYSRETSQIRVFQPAANYLMTDMLINTVQNGTAKKLFDKRYQVAAKTGTVGNKEGNSDAIIAGYTTENTFVVWCSGDLPNGISGANLPCELADCLLEKIYSKRCPQNFTVPKDVVELTLDKDGLQKNQRMLVADKGEKFLFDNLNKPKEKLENPAYNYALNVTSAENEIKIELPNVENGSWQLYKKGDGGNERLEIVNNNVFCETIINNTEYYAELIIDNEMVYVTPKVLVKYIPDEKQNVDEKPPSILDFWYYK